MNISIEEKKFEAVSRMKTIGISSEIIRKFSETGSLSISEPPSGVWSPINSEALEHIREFEEMHHALVYAAIRSYTAFGKMDCYLFVSDYYHDWEIEREGTANMDMGMTVYAYNYDDPDFSEIGCIGIEHTPAGGLQRIW